MGTMVGLQSPHSDRKPRTTGLEKRRRWRCDSRQECPVAEGCAESWNYFGSPTSLKQSLGDESVSAPKLATISPCGERNRPFRILVNSRSPLFQPIKYTDQMSAEAQARTALAPLTASGKSLSTILRKIQVALNCSWTRHDGIGWQVGFGRRGWGWGRLIERARW